MITRFSSPEEPASPTNSFLVKFNTITIEGKEHERNSSQSMGVGFNPYHKCLESV